MAESTVKFLAIVTGTFVLEDPTTVTAGVLVAEGKLHFANAFLALVTGISIGDVGLFLLGAIPWCRKRALEKCSGTRLEKSISAIRKNLLIAVLFARLIPGLRLPTYVGAGLSGVSFIRFAVMVILTSTVWAFCLLHASIWCGERIGPFLGKFQFIVLISVIGLYLLYRLHLCFQNL